MKLFIIIIIITLFTILLINSIQLNNNYDENRIYCCRRKLRCCHDNIGPIFEVKASFDKLTNEDKKHCSRKEKLHLILKITNEGGVNNANQYVIIDHVNEDGVRLPLLNPIVFKIRQELIETYDLNFLRLVNGEARETVTKCGDRTCRTVTYNGKEVPYSGGFCCSCNTSRRMTRWTRNCPQPKINLPVQVTVDYNDYKHYEFVDGGPPLAVKYLNKRTDRCYKGGKIKIRKNRDAFSCEQHKATGHCLTFSDNWYKVFSLGPPQLKHILYIRIYQKFQLLDNKVDWKHITNGYTIIIGTENNLFSNNNDVYVKYKADPIEDNSFSLDYKSQMILIPEKDINYRSEEYLVVGKRAISSDGKTCDTAGVGYEAFYNQEKRCSKHFGSCLSNQPNYYRQHDLQAEQKNRTGLYFLRNFGLPTKNCSKDQQINIVYMGKHVSILDFLINSDTIYVVEPDKYATIMAVYIEAHQPSHITITAKIFNSGLISSIYYIGLGDCPVEVPATFNNIMSKPVMIPPQKVHTFKLEIDCDLSINAFFCKLHVFNLNRKLLATRIIRFQQHDFCICAWHCLCACYEADNGLPCIPLPIENYHAAGYQGGLPITTNYYEESYFDHLLGKFFKIFLIMFIIFLLFGFIKAIIGLFIIKIRKFGLDTVLGLHQMDNCLCNDIFLSKRAMFCLNIFFFFVYPMAVISNLTKSILSTKFTNEKYDQRERCRKFRYTHNDEDFGEEMISLYEDEEQEEDVSMEVVEENGEQ